MESNERSQSNVKEAIHHKQQELCTNRPIYRQGRQLTAVKVFTVTKESQHLFVYGVPKINLRSEFKHLFSKYGQILNIHVVSDHKVEIFTECYHVHFQRIQSARIAKRLTDNRSFYGGVLHVCYAPEYETPEETLLKLRQRERDVLVRLAKFKSRESIINGNVETEHNHLKQLSVKRNYCEGNSASSIYSSEDPILSEEKKFKKFSSLVQKYITESQNSDSGQNELLKKNLINIPQLGNSLISPQLPTFCYSEKKDGFVS